MAIITKPKKNRAVNAGPKSAPAKERKELYGNAIAWINNAIEHRYPLEAIALLESMIADRLEARLAWIFEQYSDKRKFSTIGKLVPELCGKKSKESDEAKIIYNAVNEWADRRNEALHEMVKVAEREAKDWAVRMEEAQATAKAGLPLFRKLDVLVKMLNKPKPDAASKKPKN